MIDRVNILGVRVHAINMDQTLDQIQVWIEKNDPHYVCVTPAHGVMDAYHDPELRAIFNSGGLITPDGMPIVWLLKLAGQSHVSRVYGPDLTLALIDRGLTFGWRHFFYGGTPETPELLAERMKERYPALIVAGTYSPPFRDLTEDEEIKLVEIVAEASPDVIWVGISTPKQERWMAKFIDKLNVPVLIGVGAAFDFLSGRKKQAPMWMQRNGLEWFFRLVTEPRRLWKRYAQMPLFIFLVMAQKLGIKSFEK
ncbi:MAG: WecB/TagA/CpsF family glycosyltransferase [Anaerolineales bacterium]|jgi:N-acetylglucosaminyldiphosphoundecaprenol N-acetyl-beta-D-mannosaminyltransferase